MMNNFRNIWRRNPTAQLSRYDASFAQPLLALKRTGLDLANTKYKNNVEVVKLKGLYCFNIFLLITMYIAEVVWIVEGIQKQETFAELTMVAPCLVFGIMIVFKTSSLVLQGHHTRELLRGLEDMFPNVETIPEANKKIIEGIVKDSMKFSNRVVRTLFFLLNTLMVFYVVQPMYFLATGYFLRGELHLTVALEMKYPFDPFNPRFWPLAVVHQTYMGAQALLFSLPGADTFFYVCCVHIHMHFRILMHQFEALDFSENGRAEFRKLIKKHQKIIRFVDLLEALYNLSTFCNYVSSSFLICLCGFNFVMMRDVWMRVKCLVFLLTTIAQIFMLCYFGDMICSSSGDVGNALLNSRWYAGTISDQKTVLIVVMRSQQACTLTAVKYIPVNLQTFTDILKTAWSYFALLETVSGDDEEPK